MKKIIVLLGLPGSGKGTQGKKLSEHLNLPHLSTGELFRTMRHQDTPSAKILDECIKNGNLVPSDIVNDLLLSAIREDKYSNGSILDGYPRTIAQADFLKSNVNAEIIAIYFDITEELLKKRILGRRVCSDCGAIYNIFLTPNLGTNCTECQGKIVAREDDNIDIFNNRISKYKEESAPLLDYYKKSNQLIVIDANLSQDEVWLNLCKSIKND